MALTRSFLKGMGLNDEQVSAIIEAHTESTDALKAQRDDLKEKVAGFKDVQKELDDLKAKGTDDWEGKYNEEHESFEKFKKDLEAEKVKAEKETLYRELLKEVGISENRIDKILKVTNLDEFKVKDGAFETSNEMKEAAKTEWQEFIVDSHQQGANTQVPPENNGNETPDLEKLSMAEYVKARSKK